MIYFIIPAIFVVICIIIYIIINGSSNDVKNKKIIFISLIFILLMSTFGFIGIFNIDYESSLWLFFLLQLVFLTCGSIYYYLFSKKTFGLFNKPIISEISLILICMGLSYILFALLFNYFAKYTLGFYYANSIITFLIPYLFMLTFDFMASIPPEIYKIWYYPLDAEEPDFDKLDLKNIYLINLEFSKSPDDLTKKNYMAKAPVQMLFGDWYRSFINNYNYKFEEEPILFLDENNQPHGWMFFTKPKSFLHSKRFIDPDLTIGANKINEKTIIVAKRVVVN